MVTVPLVDITASALDDMAVAIAAHLESRIRNCDGLSPEIAATLQALGPAGEYQPALGSLTQQVCSPLEQGMSAFAMAEFSQMNFPRKTALPRGRLSKLLCTLYNKWLVRKKILSKIQPRRRLACLPAKQ